MVLSSGTGTSDMLVTTTFSFKMSNLVAFSCKSCNADLYFPKNCSRVKEPLYWTSRSLFELSRISYSYNLITGGYI